ARSTGGARDLGRERPVRLVAKPGRPRARVPGEPRCALWGGLSWSVGSLQATGERRWHLAGAVFGLWIGASGWRGAARGPIRQAGGRRPARAEEALGMSWLRCVAAALLASVSCLTGSSRAEQSVTSGRYLLSQRTVVKADIPILPDISTETWTVSLLELEASSSSLRGGGKVCHIEMSSSTNLVRMELPVAFQRLVSDVELEARL